MNVWIAASIALSVGLGICLLACLRADAAGALAALNLAGIVACLDLVTLTVGFSRQPFIDLAVVLAPLAMLGSLAFTRLLEHRK
ncbi:MAG TPA: monovalent cation/H+ antiporter complex subunit F [Solirubrobacteraceae bacterium]|jgi:multisubunit Na+/H+ antiporter MnhF subunit